MSTTELYPESNVHLDPLENVLATLGHSKFCGISVLGMLTQEHTLYRNQIYHDLLIIYGIEVEVSF